jgi:hypothetical protein
MADDKKNQDPPVSTHPRLDALERRVTALESACPAGTACVSPYCAVHAKANGRSDFDAAKERAQKAYDEAKTNTKERDPQKRHAIASAAALRAFHGQTALQVLRGRVSPFTRPHSKRN